MGEGSRFRWKVLACAVWMALAPVCVLAADESAAMAESAAVDSPSWSLPSLSVLPVSEAEARLAEEAEKGDARAKMALGLRYAMGRGVPADDKQAQIWLKKAAMEGHAVAQVSLAAMLAFESDAQDAAGAAVWFGKAAAQGNMQAQAELARMLETGLGVSRNPEEATQWRDEAGERARQVMLDWAFRIAATGSDKWEAKGAWPDTDRLPGRQDTGPQEKAAVQAGIASGIAAPERAGVALDVRAVGRAVESGDPQAQTVGALLLATGNGVKKDEALAAEWFGKAAEAGYAPAQAVLGELYMLGWGPLEADNAAAARWMKRAAMQGLREAQTSYGSMLAGGKGVKENRKEAFEWIRNAAEKDEARAQVMMAMNALSRGDREEAAAWFYRAAEHGDDSVLSMLGVLYGRGDAAIAGESEKLTEVRRYAQRGEPEAQLMLGLLYGEGWGAPRDAGKAERWFAEAAGRHYADVFLPLGLFYAETDRPGRAAALFGEAVRSKAYSFARDREILQLLFIETEKMPELEEAVRQGDAASGERQADGGGKAEKTDAGKAHAGLETVAAGRQLPEEAAVSASRRERIAKKIAFLKEQAASGNPAAELMLATLLAEGWSVPQDTEMARMLHERAREKICAAAGDAAADEPACLSPEAPEDEGASGAGEAEGQESGADGADEEDGGDGRSLSLKVTDYSVKGNR